uniref:EGF-like domain-containing protein n=1 Tax=Panagrolaimus superbus TaxID=310955 RepID=A0A914YPM1_9BILA
MFLVFVFIGLLSFSYCNDDSSSREAASNYECQNGGILKDGKCECQVGFLGSRCQRTMHCAGHKVKIDGTCVKCDDGYIGLHCDVIQCKNGQRLYGEICNCTKPWSGRVCDQLLTSDVYLYYNRMITQFGPIGVIIIIPMILIRYGCSKLARKRQVKRVERSLEEQNKTDVSATIVANLLHK